MIFICPSCDDRTGTIAVYSFTFNGDGKVFLDDRKSPIRCNKCNVNMVTDPEKDKWDGGMPAYGKFASMSPAEKQKLLKKRSKEHAKKHTREYRRYLDTKDLPLK